MDLDVHSRNANKKKRLVRKLAQLGREQKKIVDEQIKRLIQKQKENKRRLFSGTETEARDVIPGKELQYLEFKFQLDIHGRPPFELSFYFPDIYDMAVQDPSQKAYMNYRKTYWLSIQYFAIMKLSDEDKDLIRRWTQTEDYAITTQLLQIFFKKNCEPRKSMPKSKEDLESIMNTIVSNIIRQKLFPKFIQDWETYEKQQNELQQNQNDTPNQDNSLNALIRRPILNNTTYKELKKILSENNYAKVREAVVAFIKELYRINRLLKPIKDKFCPPDFWDGAGIYVFRGHNDIDYNNPDFDHNSGVFSTSLEFNVAAGFTTVVSNSFMKVKQSKDDEYIKNTVYILKLSYESNALFTMPLSRFDHELEITLLPDNEEAFMQSLQDCMHLTVDDILCKSTAPLQSDDMVLDGEVRDTMRRVHSVKERGIRFEDDTISFVHCDSWYILSPDTGYILKVVKTYE